MKNFIKIAIICLFVLNWGTFAFAITNIELREQAKLLYIANQNDEAAKKILLIPDAQKTAQDYFLLGNTAKTKKEAIAFYKKAITLKPKYPQAYFNLADIYYKSKDYEQAIVYYKQAIKYDKKFAYAYYNLGCTYLAAEKYNPARKAFESAIALSPEEPDYYYNLAFAHKKLNNTKRTEKALNLYNELIKRRNEN